MRKVSREIDVGSAQELNVGAYAIPYSFPEAAEQAQENGSRLMTNAEYQKAISNAERELERALQRDDARAAEQYRRELAYLQGNKLDGVGYAGARTRTGTILGRDGNGYYLQDVDGISGRYLYGTKRHERFLPELVGETTRLQELARQEGLQSRIRPYIQEVVEDENDPNFGFPIRVGPEPNPRYHGAIFWIPPYVLETGTGNVVRGPDHAVGGPMSAMVFPLGYKDKMLGHRTVDETSSTGRSKLISTAVGVVGILMGELLQDAKIERSPKELEKIAKHYLSMGYFKNARINRRAILKGGAAALATLLGGGNAYAQEYRDAVCGVDRTPARGVVAGRLDGVPINGRIILRNGPQTFTAPVRGGRYRIDGIPEGLYEGTLHDPEFNSFVPYRKMLYASECHYHTSVIERGQNRRFPAVPIGDNFLQFYAKMAQRVHQVSPGITKWGNYDPPQFVVTVDSSVPPEYNDAGHYGKFLTFLDMVIQQDTSKFYGGRLTTMPRVSGVPSDLTIEVSFERGLSAVGIADYPSTIARRIVRARTRYEPDIVLAQMPFINQVPAALIHEFGHNAGYADFVDSTFDSIMNYERRAPIVTINDQIVGYLAYHPEVQPGNTFPDNNP